MQCEQCSESLFMRAGYRRQFERNPKTASLVSAKQRHGLPVGCVCVCVCVCVCAVQVCMLTLYLYHRQKMPVINIEDLTEKDKLKMEVDQLKKEVTLERMMVSR